MKNVFHLSVIAVMLFSCSSGNKPGENFAREKVTNYLLKKDSARKCAGMYSYQLNKVDGVNQEVNGVKVYSIQYEITKTATGHLSKLSTKNLIGDTIILPHDSALATIADIEDYNKKFGSRYDKAPTIIQEYKKGDVVRVYENTFVFGKFENGWQMAGM